MNEIHEVSEDTSESFYPKGSIAFFLLMAMFFILVWGGIYLLMINRA